MSRTKRCRDLLRHNYSRQLLNFNSGHWDLTNLHCILKFYSKFSNSLVNTNCNKSCNIHVLTFNSCFILCSSVVEVFFLNDNDQYLEVELCP